MLAFQSCLLRPIPDPVCLCALTEGFYPNTAPVPLTSIACADDQSLAHLCALGFPLGLLLQDVQPHTLTLGQGDERLVILSNDKYI